MSWHRELLTIQTSQTYEYREQTYNQEAHLETHASCLDFQFWLRVKGARVCELTK